MMNEPNSRSQNRARHPNATTGAARDLVLALLGWVRHTVHGFYTIVGLFLSLGFGVSLLGLGVLAVLTGFVMDGEILRFDQAVLRSMNIQAVGPLDAAMLEITAIGDTLVVLVIAGVASSLLWLLQRRGYAVMLLVAVVGAESITGALKMIFDRPRPQLFQHLDEVGTSSFPSGHAAKAMVLFVALTYVIHRLAPRRWVSVLAVTVAGALIVLIGLSRLYLGVHYPSDVLAGYAVGFAWATFCALGLEVRRSTRRQGPTGAEREPENPSAFGNRDDVKHYTFDTRG